MHLFLSTGSSALISSHLIPSYPIQSNPIPSHFISSHLISSNLISSHLISSHLISSHLSLSVSIASTKFLHIHLCWCEPAKYPSINPSMHRSICLSSWSIQKNLPSSVPSIGPSVPCRISGWDFHVSKQTQKMLLVDPSPDGYRWISMIHINPNGKMVMTWGPVRCTKSLGFLWFLCIQFASASTYP